eukprot:873832-Pleurochrysis_carterae.AAC.1
MPYIKSFLRGLRVVSLQLVPGLKYRKNHDTYMHAVHVCSILMLPYLCLDALTCHGTLLASAESYAGYPGSFVSVRVSSEIWTVYGAVQLKS